jgi:hypothetical protein
LDLVDPRVPTFKTFKELMEEEEEQQQQVHYVLIHYIYPQIRQVINYKRVSNMNSHHGAESFFKS